MSVSTILSSAISGIGKGISFISDFFISWKNTILIICISVLVISTGIYILQLRSRINYVENQNVTLQKDLIISQVNIDTLKNSLESQNLYIETLERESENFKIELAKSQEEVDSLILLEVHEDNIITDSAETAIDWLRNKHR